MNTIYIYLVLNLKKKGLLVGAQIVDPLFDEFDGIETIPQR